MGTLFFVDDEWYQNRVVGRDMCDRFMKLSLCKSLKLDGEYTNHSIRSTVITTLDKAGFEARHIIKLSSHKSETTIKEYSTRCPENKRKAMFDSLTNAIQPKNKKIKQKPEIATSTVTKNQTPDLQLNDVKLDLPTFELQEIADFDTIDDELLVQMMTDHDKENTNDNINNNNNQTNPGEVAIQNQNVVQPPQINTQVINQNMLPQFRMPAMYFPNSNVTINYNFSK